MKKWVILQLLLLLAVPVAHAEMTVQMHRHPTSAEDELDVEASAGDLNAEIQDELGSVSDKEMQRQARVEKQRRLADQKRIAAEERRRRDMARKQAAARGQAVPGPDPLPSARATTITTPAPTQNTGGVPRSYMPAGNDPLPDDTHVAQVSYRRSWITLVPTFIIGVGITEADYISATATNGSLSHSWKYNYGGGLLADFGKSRFSIETGVLYFTEVVNASYSYTSNVYSYGAIQTISDDASLGFIGVPILGKVNFAPFNSRTRLNVNAGIVPALLINNTFDYRITSSSLYQDISDPNSSQLNMGGFRSYNVFLQAGVGIDQSITASTDGRIGLVYRRALMSLTNNNNTAVDDFLLTLGVGFDL